MAVGHLGTSLGCEGSTGEDCTCYVVKGLFQEGEHGHCAGALGSALTRSGHTVEVDRGELQCHTFPDFEVVVSGP